MKQNNYIILLAFTILNSFWFTPSLNAQDGESNNLLKKVDNNTYLLKDIEIRTDERTVSFPCRINMEKGLLEVALCTPQGKTHESLLVTDISPVEFQTVMLLLGLDPVNEIPDDPKLIDPLSPYKTIETYGDSVLIFLETETDGKIERKRIEDFIRDESKGTKLEKSTWIFRGVVTHQNGHVIIDPETTMVATYHDPLALMELNSESKFNDELYYVNDALNLKKGQAVKIIIQAIH
jgi:hypothetical protein